MAELNAAITSRPDLSMAENRAHNATFDFNTHSYLLGRKPEYFVYLFSISKESYKVARPPIAKEITIPAVKQNVDGTWPEYVYAGRIPQPLLTPRTSVDSSAMDVDTQDARRFAMDIINSENLGFNQDAVIDPRSSYSQGHDLGKKGVFWAVEDDCTFLPSDKEKKNPIPSAKDLASAKKRLEAYYTDILAKARAVEVSNPAELRNMLTPEHHAAADYFGEEYTWHGKKSRPMDCPNCGTRVKEGIAYHVVDGELCIINWARTVKSGKRTRQQAFEATGDPQFAQVPVSTVTTAVGMNQMGPAKVAKSDIPTE